MSPAQPHATHSPVRVGTYSAMNGYDDNVVNYTDKGGRTNVAEIQPVYSTLFRVPLLTNQFAGKHQLSRGSSEN